MNELPDVLRSRAEETLEDLRKHEDPREDAVRTEKWTSMVAISRQPFSPDLGLNLSERLALTPSDSALARAIENSELPVATRYVTWRGQACLLFEKPQREDLLRDAVLGKHVAEELATRLTQEDEDVPSVSLNKGWGRRRWSLALRPVAAADTERYDSEKMPFEAFTVGGEEYILCCCTSKQLYFERGGTEEEFGRKFLNILQATFDRTLEEVDGDEEAEEVADQLRTQPSTTNDPDPFEAFLRIEQESE